MSLSFEPLACEGVHSVISGVTLPTSNGEIDVAWINLDGFGKIGDRTVKIAFVASRLTATVVSGGISRVDLEGFGEVTNGSVVIRLVDPFVASFNVVRDGTLGMGNRSSEGKP